MIGVLLFSIVVIVCNAEVVNVNCVSVRGTTYKSLPDVSITECPAGYALVGCNSFGQHPHEVVGSWVEGDKCYSSGSAGSQGAKSYARCCQLPKCSTCNVAAATGDGVSIVQCSQNEELTGCAAHTTDVGTGKFRVGAAGDDMSGWAATPSATGWVSTDNTCSASGFTQNTNTEYLQSTASCCSLPPNYALECNSRWIEQTVNSQMACPSSDQFMTSCVARNNDAFTLDYYYVNDAGKCATQMNNGLKQWVQAICCTLTKTGEDQACSCDNDSECPAGEVCCKVRKTCHPPPV